MSEAPPWILLRGLMRDQRHWGGFPDIFRATVAGSQVHLIDLPGNGLRNHEPSARTVPAMAQWLRQALQAQGLQPPYRLFAMSLGAMVAVAWADAHPSEIDACVLANTSLRPVSPFHHRLQAAAWPLLLCMALGAPSAREAESAILQLTSCNPTAANAVLDDWVRWRQSHPVSRRNALRQLLAAARYSAPRQTPACRLLLLNGGADRLVHPACSRQLAQRWQCPLVIHPHAGHDLSLDAPEWVATTVRDWLPAA